MDRSAVDHLVANVEIRDEIYSRSGLLDEITIHLVPLLLGDGRRLFVDVDDRGIALERTRTIETANATHLTFSVTTRAAA